MVEYYYDAWGNYAINDTSNMGLGEINPFRYRGYFYDTDMGLYYLKTRYYDPEVGRFINMDGISYADPETLNGLNLYAYCGNNPVMNVDPEGTWSWKGFWNVVAAVATVVAVTAAVVVTAGAAAVALGAGATVAAGAAVGAAVGGTVVGSIEIANQVQTNGVENINLDSVATSAFGGALVGAAAGGFIGIAAGGGTGALAIANGGSIAVNGSSIALSSAALLGVGILYSTTSNKGGYWGQKYSNDHAPDHIHLKGVDGTNVRIGRDGNPLPGEPKLKPQQRKALKRLWSEFLRLFG